MKLIVVSTLYPNVAQHRHGIFVETRLLQTLSTNQIDATVIAPVPWFPNWLGFLSDRYEQYARIPLREERSNITVYHPRYLVVPRIGMLLTPFFLALAVSRTLRKLIVREGEIDIIDAHYFYPDGVAAAMVAFFSGIPLLITARGSDINKLSNFRLPKKMMQWASRIARFNIAVSRPLAELMEEQGIGCGNTRIVPNGVDLKTFTPLPVEDRPGPGHEHAPLVISIGNLVELKGHDLVIRAMLDVPAARLLIVGDGPLKPRLSALVNELGLANRVEVRTAVPRDQLIALYRSAALSVLASSSEGMPNVVLESLACGTPVVATPVGGVPDVIVDPDMGRLVEARSSEHIAAAIQSLLRDRADPDIVRSHAERLSWETNIQKLVEIYASITRASCEACDTRAR